MPQSIIQVDAFTNKPFGGNPAAVCVLSSLQSDIWMQNIAQEINLSETAFLLAKGDGFDLRWFTPTVEVPLCGHATLASAHVLWSEGYLDVDNNAKFYTKSGILIARKKDDWIELDFPVNPSWQIEKIPQLAAALDVDCIGVYQNSLGYLVEVASAEIVQKIQPNFSEILKLPMSQVIVTSVGDQNSEYDFVSRFFAPGLGINEDPVTGAAHCCLAPFWHERFRLSKLGIPQNQFIAYQASSRGGIVKVRYTENDSRVLISGQAITTMRGELVV
ncbi:PhzF family phenazine biosynthesis protein [Calothrix sp. PCC 6303]|uniref:PhzF family phenazine biosynthesis protein n=1 Tax=Calothrix sp. PCC 6303 TaxID=1170562 RepID=UPI0002A04F55|nr:PhzF family phenazine biosynthesis protein [Calothrix sp. PCC 6303]AFZ02618.1 phenazine biosynthesis protein PhzF family [Calothrix sp. PCC 6303]